MATERLGFDIFATDNASRTFDKVARAADNVNQSMLRATKLYEQSATGSKKLQDARFAEANAISKVQIAEQRLLETRANSSAKTSSILSAEKALLSARHDAAKAADRTREVEGQENGKSFTRGFAHWLTGAGKKEMEAAGTAAGDGVSSGIMGVLKTPVIGPALLLGAAAVAATAAPAAGAIIGAALVGGIGTGLAGIGIVFAAKARSVQQIWHGTLSAMGDKMSVLSKPFENTVIAMALVAQRTFGKLAPFLGAAFRDLAPAVTRFGDDLGKAFEKFGPMLRPVSDAFGAILKALGPAMIQLFGQISTSMTQLSVSVAKNPTAIADMVRGLSDLTGFLLMTVTDLNNADAAFKRLTGGTSSVTATMDILKGVFYSAFGSIDLVARGVKGLADGLHYLWQRQFPAKQGQEQLTAATHEGSAGLAQMASITDQVTLKQLAANDAARAAAAAITRQTAATNNLITAMHIQSGLLISVREAEINYRQAVADAAAQINKHRGALSLNTQAGRDNQRQLDNIAQAANTQYDAMIRSNSGVNAANAAAQRARAQFVTFAEKMGYSKKQAQALAAQMIDTQKHIDAMHGKTIPITYTISGQNFTLNTKTPSRVGGLATGGPVTGPGTGTSDTAGLFRLSNNEYVVKAASSQKYGQKAMASVNAGTATIIPGMAAGGAVNIHGYGVFRNNAQMQKYLMQHFGGAPTGPSGAAGAGGGAGVQKWRAVALQALALAHEPPSWIGSLLSRMQRESGGNPRAINLWDSNAKAGTPSIGLMQTIGPTFNAYAGALRGRGIYDPLANIYAAIKYTVARYGSGPAGWNRPGGYKNGGWLMPGQLAYNETRKPEAVFNQAQLSAMTRPIVVQLVLDGNVIHQSLVKLNKDRGHRGLGLGMGEKG